MSKQFTVLMVLGLSTFIGACGAPTKIVSHPDAQAHVVILSGIIGSQGGAETLKRQLEDEGNQLGWKVSAQIWPWHKIRPKLNPLDLLDDPYNAERGKELARQFRAWRNELRANGKSVEAFLIGGSAGSIIAFEACAAEEDGKPILDDGFFQRIVFVSATAPSDKPCDDVKRACQSKDGRPGLFNYYSAEDSLLKATPTAMGLIGADTPMYQFKWIMGYGELRNKGDHLQCYAPGFCRRYILPLFSENGRIPEEGKKWKYE